MMEFYVYKDVNNNTVISVIPPLETTDYQVIVAEKPEDLIIDANGNVRVKTEAEKLAEKKQMYLQSLPNVITNWIHSYYPPVKQQSDLADYITYTTLLRSMTAPEAELSAIIANIAKSIIEFSTTARSSYASVDDLIVAAKNYFDQLVTNLVTSYSMYPANALIQLSKIAVRTAQVEHIKSIYYATINALQSATSLADLDNVYNSITNSYVWIQV